MIDLIPKDFPVLELAALRRFIDSPEFEILCKAIESREFELRYELARKFIDSQTVGAVSDAVTTEIQALKVSALRWKVAREVLAEVASQKFSPIAGAEVIISP